MAPMMSLGGFPAEASINAIRFGADQERSGNYFDLTGINNAHCHTLVGQEFRYGFPVSAGCFHANMGLSVVVSRNALSQ